MRLHRPGTIEFMCIENVVRQNKPELLRSSAAELQQAITAAPTMSLINAIKPSGKEDNPDNKFFNAVRTVTQACEP